MRLTIRAVLVAVLLVSAGCSTVPYSDGRVVPHSAVIAALPGVVGDLWYAPVRSAALPAIYRSFRSDLSQLGLVKFDARFDCNHFASFYISSAQVRYVVQRWHAKNQSETLALAEVWYAQAGGGHAIVAAFTTDRGLVFIEPQTGQELQLTAAERASIFFVRW